MWKKRLKQQKDFKRKTITRTQLFLFKNAKYYSERRIRKFQALLAFAGALNLRDNIRYKNSYNFFKWFKFKPEPLVLSKTNFYWKKALHLYKKDKLNYYKHKLQMPGFQKLFLNYASTFLEQHPDPIVKYEHMRLLKFLNTNVGNFILENYKNFYARQSYQEYFFYLSKRYRFYILKNYRLCKKFIKIIDGIGKKDAMLDIINKTNKPKTIRLTYKNYWNASAYDIRKKYRPPILKRIIYYLTFNRQYRIKPPLRHNRKNRAGFRSYDQPKKRNLKFFFANRKKIFNKLMPEKNSLLFYINKYKKLPWILQRVRYELALLENYFYMQYNYQINAYGLLNGVWFTFQKNSKNADFFLYRLVTDGETWDLNIHTNTLRILIKLIDKQCLIYHRLYQQYKHFKSINFLFKLLQLTPAQQIKLSKKSKYLRDVLILRTRLHFNRLKFYKRYSKKHIRFSLMEKKHNILFSITKHLFFNDANRINKTYKKWDRLGQIRNLKFFLENDNLLRSIPDLFDKKLYKRFRPKASLEYRRLLRRRKRLSMLKTYSDWHRQRNRYRYYSYRRGGVSSVFKLGKRFKKLTDFPFKCNKKSRKNKKNYLLRELGKKKSKRKKKFFKYWQGHKAYANFKKIAYRPFPKAVYINKIMKKKTYRYIDLIVRKQKVRRSFLINELKKKKQHSRHYNYFWGKSKHDLQLIANIKFQQVNQNYNKQVDILYLFRQHLIKLQKKTVFLQTYLISDHLLKVLDEQIIFIKKKKKISLNFNVLLLVRL
jgi:hypothetical protein